MTKEEEIIYFNRALLLLKNRLFNGICACLYSGFNNKSKTYCSYFEYKLEFNKRLNKYKPKDYYEGTAFWFHPNETTKRIELVEKIIKDIENE